MQVSYEDLCKILEDDSDTFAMEKVFLMNTSWHREYKKIVENLYVIFSDKNKDFYEIVFSKDLSDDKSVLREIVDIGYHARPMKAVEKTIVTYEPIDGSIAAKEW